MSRPVRWDSDHVVILNDSVAMLAQEIVWADALNKVNIGLDYFDASINRIGAYVIGSRATQKAFLQALLSRSNSCVTTSHQVVSSSVWQLSKRLRACHGQLFTTTCLKNNTPVAEDYITEIETYEKSDLETLILSFC